MLTVQKLLKSLQGEYFEILPLNEFEWR